jgi:predicted metal-dependent hydrolase
MSIYPQGHFSIEYGTQTIGFELVYSEREAMAIHVHPDSSVVVDAPMGTDYEQVMERVQKKAKWVAKQQRLYAQHQPTINRIPRYASGETHYYLGKQYRLKVIQDDVERVKFYRGRLYLHVHQLSNYDRKSDLLNQWYRTRADFIFSQQLDVCHPLVEPFGVSYPTLKIRAMKSRWGSASPSGSITLNLRLIHVPKKLINYVILHELCHLKEMNHSSQFYDLLSRILPSWEQYRDELNSLEYV